MDIACDCCAKREGDWTTFCDDCNETAYAEDACGTLEDASRHLGIAKDLERDPKRRRALVRLALTDIADAVRVLGMVAVAPKADALAEFYAYLDEPREGGT